MLDWYMVEKVFVMVFGRHLKVALGVVLYHVKCLDKRAQDRGKHNVGTENCTRALKYLQMHVLLFVTHNTNTETR